MFLYLLQLCDALGIDPCDRRTKNSRSTKKGTRWNECEAAAKSTRNCDADHVANPAFVIIYRATKSKFLDDALSRDIEQVVAEAYRERTGARVAPSEFRAWRESLLQMAKVLHDEGIPDRSGVAIEYRIPQTNKRVDFIVTGLDRRIIQGHHRRAQAVVGCAAHGQGWHRAGEARWPRRCGGRTAPFVSGLVLRLLA